MEPFHPLVDRRRAVQLIPSPTRTPETKTCTHLLKRLIRDIEHHVLALCWSGGRGFVLLLVLFLLATAAVVLAFFRALRFHALCVGRKIGIGYRCRYRYRISSYVFVVDIEYGHICRYRY